MEVNSVQQKKERLDKCEYVDGIIRAYLGPSILHIGKYTYGCNLKYILEFVHIKISTQKVSAHTCTHTSIHPYIVCEHKHIKSQD